jgi:hypothetical protein
MNETDDPLAGDLGAVRDRAIARALMNETDDRLEGDHVWELFTHAAPGTASESNRTRRYQRWLAVAGLIAMAWLLSPLLAVVAACLAVAARDFRTGRQLARSMPDKAGGTICARFTYAWGAWKLALAAFALTFVLVPVFAPTVKEKGMPPALWATMLLWMGGFILSAAFTASGLLAAYRSGMRVWIGEGVNQARTLLMGMLMVGLTFVVLLPLCAWFVGQLPPAKFSHGRGVLNVLLFFGCMFAAAVVLLLILDWFSRRVIADHPSKFGPKVPTVGKWDS